MKYLTKTQMFKRIKDLEKAIRWADGEIGDFNPPSVPGKIPPYWWRRELMKRAKLISNWDAIEKKKKQAGSHDQPRHPELSEWKSKELKWMALT